MIPSRIGKSNRPQAELAGGLEFKTHQAGHGDAGHDDADYESEGDHCDVEGAFVRSGGCEEVK